MDRLHLLETAEWVAFGNQLVDWSLVEGASDQQNDVINHIAVSKI